MPASLFHPYQLPAQPMCSLLSAVHALQVWDAVWAHEHEEEDEEEEEEDSSSGGGGRPQQRTRGRGGSALSRRRKAAEAAAGGDVAVSSRTPPGPSRRRNSRGSGAASGPSFLSLWGMQNVCGRALMEHVTVTGVRDNVLSEPRIQVVAVQQPQAPGAEQGGPGGPSSKQRGRQEGSGKDAKGKGWGVPAAEEWRGTDKDQEEDEDEEENTGMDMPADRPPVNPVTPLRYARRGMPPKRASLFFRDY
jgi:hypothetical protein